MTEDQGPSKRPRIDAGENGSASLVDGPASEAGLEQALAVQQELVELDNEGSLAILRLEQEYVQKKRPAYERRAKALSQIPGFWFNVLLQSSVAGYISEADKDILQHLTTLDVLSDPINAMYTIRLGFESNSFFTNSFLDRKVTRNDEGHAVVECSPVSWHEGHDLSAQQTATGGTELELFMFLNWFVTEGVYEEATGDTIAETIRTHIWPNPLLIYTGDFVGEDEFEVAGEEEDGDEEEEGDDGDEDDDADGPEADEDEDEDEDEEDDDEEDEEEDDGGDDDGDDDEDDAL